MADEHRMSAPTRGARRPGSPRPGAGFVLALLGLAAVILVARDHVWALGHWSQDLSPVPLLAGIALSCTAFDGLGALAGAQPGPNEPQFGAGIDMRDWHYLGIVLTAVGLALLGRSGLALGFGAVIGAALAGVCVLRGGRKRCSIRWRWW